MFNANILLLPLLNLTLLDPTAVALPTENIPAMINPLTASPLVSVQFQYKVGRSLALRMFLINFYQAMGTLPTRYSSKERDGKAILHQPTYCLFTHLLKHTETAPLGYHLRQHNLHPPMLRRQPHNKRGENGASFLVHIHATPKLHSRVVPVDLTDNTITPPNANIARQYEFLTKATKCTSRKT